MIPTPTLSYSTAMQIDYDPPEAFPGVVAVTFTPDGETIGRAYQVPSRDAMGALLAALKLAAEEGGRCVGAHPSEPPAVRTGCQLRPRT